MKFSFLEFDEQKAKGLCDNSAELHLMKAQHSKDTAIMKQLIEIIEMQNEQIKKLVTSVAWIQKEPYYLVVAKETLTAVESKLKELNEKP